MENIVLTHLTVPEVRQLFRQELESFFANQTTTPQTTTGAERPLTVDEAATFLHLSPHTIYSLVSRRAIPCLKKGNRLYFDQEELTRWLQDGRKKTSTELQAEAAGHTRRKRA